MEILSITLTALIGGIVAFLFNRIESKIDKLEAENNAHHKEQIAVRKAEREMMLAVAETTMLTAKKVNNRNSVNGELEASIKELQERKQAVQDITREIAFERLEN